MDNTQRHTKMWQVLLFAREHNIKESNDSPINSLIDWEEGLNTDLESIINIRRGLRDDRYAEYSVKSR